MKSLLALAGIVLLAIVISPVAGDGSRIFLQPGNLTEIHRMVEELAAAGKAILLVSSELPELLRLSDRLVVLHEGRVAARYDARDATQELIMAAATAASPPEARP
jgi:ABC-type uncharacterized transport system ATPase subunit